MPLERRILFFPAFDRTDPDPSKDYGVGCLEIRFLLDGPAGSVEFQLLIQAYLPHVMERRLQRLKRDVLAGKSDFLLRNFIEPNPLDICRWSAERLTEDDTYFDAGISYFRNHLPCYYSYEFRNPQDERSVDAAYAALVQGGDAALWKYLEDYYYREFGKPEVGIG
jgi:hypothetical protein